MRYSKSIVGPTIRVHEGSSFALKSGVIWLENEAFDEGGRGYALVNHGSVTISGGAVKYWGRGTATAIYNTEGAHLSIESGVVASTLALQDVGDINEYGMPSVGIDNSGGTVRMTGGEVRLTMAECGEAILDDYGVQFMFPYGGIRACERRAKSGAGCGQSRFPHRFASSQDEFCVVKAPPKILGILRRFRKTMVSYRT